MIDLISRVDEQLEQVPECSLVENAACGAGRAVYCDGIGHLEREKGARSIQGAVEEPLDRERDLVERKGMAHETGQHADHSARGG